MGAGPKASPAWRAILKAVHGEPGITLRNLSKATGLQDKAILEEVERRGTRSSLVILPQGDLLRCFAASPPGSLNVGSWRLLLQETTPTAATVYLFIEHYGLARRHLVLNNMIRRGMDPNEANAALHELLAKKLVVERNDVEPAGLFAQRLPLPTPQQREQVDRALTRFIQRQTTRGHLEVAKPRRRQRKRHRRATERQAPTRPST